MATLTTEAERLLALQDPVALEAASDDIAGAMESHWGLSLRDTYDLEARGGGGWCDGMSIAKEGLVLYRPTGSRRDRFTLAHELAHMFVTEDDDVLVWLADQQNPSRTQEQLCDLLASRILIPPSRIDAALNGRPLEGATVRRLHDLSEASWSACAIALAGRLGCEGFVAIVDRRNHQIMYSARATDTHPYAWKGDALPAGHPLRTLTTSKALKAWWPRFNVNEPRPYYVSAEVSDSWMEVVFADNDLWQVEKLHIPAQDQDDRRHDGTISCPSCGYDGPTRMYPCSTCGAATCQRCGKCDCDRNNERPRDVCKVCTMSVLPHLITDGICVDCS